MAESGDENTCYNQWIECDWWELEGLCNDAIGIAVGILPRLASLPGEPPLYALVVDSAIAAGFLGVVEEAKNNRDFDVSEQTEPINIAGRLRYVYAAEFVEWAARRGYPIPDFVLAGVRDRHAQTKRNERKLTANAESQCRNWLIAEMQAGDPQDTKTGYFEKALAKFGVGRRAFDRAWGYAVSKTGATNWSVPGRRKSSTE